MMAKKLLATFGIAACGLVTSVLTALLNVLVEKLINFNLFTLSVAFIIPAGAIGAGLAAASGYYFGCLYFHKRPSRMLLIQMILIAGFTNFLIYYFDYTTLVLDSGIKASDVVPFLDYLNLVLTKAHYSVGRGMHDVGEVGTMGYWIAGLNFVGFLLGGLSIFAILKSRLTCSTCEMYLRQLAKKTAILGDSTVYQAYLTRLLESIGSMEAFKVALKETGSYGTKKGACKLDTTLFGCPQCKSQKIKFTTQVYNGQDWRDVDNLTVVQPLADGESYLPIFK
jgi:hypothetical protein